MAQPDGSGAVTQESINKNSLIADKSYILYYRYGNIPQLKKVFYFSGDIKDAIARARMHCIKMGYTFILVKHFIEDLDLQEKMKTEKPEEYVENTMR